jgi:hypothetical protein
MFSSEPVVAWRLLAAVTVACAAISAAAAPVSHCQANEKVFFSCIAGKKTVSLCGLAGVGGELTSLTYRYGLPGKVENEFSATPSNGKTFLGTVEPDSPRAQIREVWFDRGDIRYLLTACLGGDCPYDGGLAVLKKSKVLSKSRCSGGPDAMASFSDDLVEFGDGTDNSRSHTPLLKIGDYSNSPELLYPVPASAFR